MEDNTNSILAAPKRSFRSGGNVTGLSYHGDAALIRLTARRAHVRRAGDLLGGLLGKGVLCEQWSIEGGENAG